MTAATASEVMFFIEDSELFTEGKISFEKTSKVIDNVYDYTIEVFMTDTPYKFHYLHFAAMFDGSDRFPETIAYFRIMNKNRMSLIIF